MNTKTNQKEISVTDPPQKAEPNQSYGDISSYFDVAKKIVTRAEEIGTNNRVILVADDEPLTFELISEFFSDANLRYKILRADTGRKAYTLALKELPDLIITDWIMPEFDGPDLIKKLKANPATENIPVIITSGAVFDDNKLEQVLATGAVGYISKPIDDKELIARVKTALALNTPESEVNQQTGSIVTKNHMLHSLIEVAPNPVFYMDRLGCLLDCNKDFEMLIGEQKSDMLGKTVYDFFPEEYAIELEKSFSKLTSLGIVSRCEIEMEDHHGRARNLELSYVGFGSSFVEVIIGSISENLLQ